MLHIARLTRRRHCLFALGFFLGLAGTAQADANDDQTYLAYLAKFKSGEALAEARGNGQAAATVGARLRFLYTKTSFYNPYSDPSSKQVNEAITHRAAGRLEECIAAAQAALEVNYTNLGAHYLMGRCAGALGDDARTKQFMIPWVLLLTSITQEPGRDGTTPDTSFRAISVAEEYVVLGHMGFKTAMKTLEVDKAGEPNDCHHRANDDTGEPRKICFNVRTAMSALAKQLGKQK